MDEDDSQGWHHQSELEQQEQEYLANSVATYSAMPADEFFALLDSVDKETKSASL